jgi:hypothetical protein
MGQPTAGARHASKLLESEIMARGRVVVLKRGADGSSIHGYVKDAAIRETYKVLLNVFFDVRHLRSSASIGEGDRVEFDYDLNDRSNIPPRMLFDSLRVIED